MGNESSTTEVLPEDGAPENVVPFPHQENLNDSLKAEDCTESLTQRDNRALLNDPSTSQQSLLSQPVLPDVPVITGVEENTSIAGDQEDKEELEFPHDLLPSLDFSSELNIWESSLGTQTSSGERKCEQVNPLLAGLQHHMEVSRPLVALDIRPHDCDTVLTDAQPSPRPSATPCSAGRPLTPPQSALIDRELQEAFQECEEQMVSLGLLQFKEPLSTTPETVNEKEKKAGEAMVNEPSESSSLPPIVVQPGHSNGGHGNKSTHGNSEAANSQMDTVVFSFRNYILGTETESEIKTARSQEKCSEIKPEKETEKDEQKQTSLQADLEMTTNTDSFKETQNDAVFSEQRDDVKEAHVEFNAVSPDCNTAVREKDMEVITETVDIKKENQSDEAINASVVESGKNDDSVNETSDCSNLHFTDRDVITEMQSEKQTEANSHAEEDQDSKTDKQVDSPSAGQDKKTKKKEKRKQRKKKKTEKTAETEQETKATAAQAENDLQAVPLINAGNKTGVCREQPDNGFDYKQQLSLGGTPSSSSPLLSSHIQQDPLTDMAWSPASNQALSQGPHQSDNHNHTEAPCGMNHSSDASTQRKQHATGDVINNQNTTVTYVQTAVINPAASADKRSDAQTQEAIVTSEADIHIVESQSSLSNSQTCVGESSVASESLYICFCCHNHDLCVEILANKTSLHSLSQYFCCFKNIPDHLLLSHSRCFQ